MPVKWTPEALAAEALKYTTRAAFKAGSYGAYGAAVRHGLLDSLCAHMGKPHMGKGQKWTLDSIAASASAYTSPGVWNTADPNAYAAARRLGVMDVVTAHMGTAHERWTFEKVQTEALNYQHRNGFWQGSPRAARAAMHHGWMDTVCSHMESRSVSWTPEMLAEAAASYTTRSAFAAGNLAAYKAAQVSGLLNSVCAHMQPVRTLWTDEDCAAEALLYMTRSAFQRHSHAYSVARNRGILDSICAHMDYTGKGFNAALPAFLYYLKVKAPLGDLYKIGITNGTIADRFRLGCDLNMIEVLAFDPYENGTAARAAESSILKAYADALYTGHPVLASGGNSELFTYDVLGLDTASHGFRAYVASLDLGPVQARQIIEGSTSRLLTAARKQATAEGMRLIQIYPDEWATREGAIRHLLDGLAGKHRKVGARQCAVCTPSRSEAAAFMRRYHIQGSAPGSRFYGLRETVSGDLVAVMVMSKPYSRRGRALDGSWELVRFATACTVAGGLTRLWKAMLTDLDPLVVTTYADLRWFTGNSYALLGMAKTACASSYDYLYKGKRYHKSSFKKADCWRRLGCAPDDRTERQLTEALGAVRMPDAGRATWVWTKP